MKLTKLFPTPKGRRHADRAMSPPFFDSQNAAACDLEDADPARERPSWDDFFLTIAEAVSLRADCSRRRVGAVIVTYDHRIVSTGYNGAPANEPGCLSGACPRATSGVEPGSSYDNGPGSCIAIHAEANALLYAGQRLDGASLYVTSEPCDGCLKLIRAAGVLNVIHSGGG